MSISSADAPHKGSCIPRWPQNLVHPFNSEQPCDKNHLVYASVAKGFRPGGGNQPIPTSGPLGEQCEENLQEKYNTTSFVNAPLSYKPDSVWSYELGEKVRMLDGRLTINSAVYYVTWNGTQQYIPLACGYPYNDNAGDAEVRGVEVELSALIVSGLSVFVNASYVDAKFVVGSSAAGISPGRPRRCHGKLIEAGEN